MNGFISLLMTALATKAKAIHPLLLFIITALIQQAANKQLAN